MILVDDRGGSCELVAPLKKAGYPVEECRLPAADVVFEGRGIGGAELSIGIEYKKLPELIGSIRTGRLPGLQLPTMKECGFDMSWLVVEGQLLYDRTGRIMRRRRDGELEPMPGSMGVGELHKRLYGLLICAGLHPWWTQDQRETVTAIGLLYRWWTDKDLDEHRSHMDLYQPSSLVPITDFQATLMPRAPGVGYKVAVAAEERFQSVRRAANATVDEWAALETTDRKGKTKRVGQSVATRIVDFFNGR